MDDNVFADEMIHRLNRLIENEPEIRRVLERIIETRFAVDSDVAVDHPTVQCEKSEDGTHWVVGALGILNGLVGIQDNGWGYVAAVFDERPDGSLELTGFRRPNIPAEKNDES